MTLIDQIKADREKGTNPKHGKWGWYGGYDDLYLATENGGRRYVMGFIRKGFKSAQPTFQISGCMYGAIDDLTTYVVGDGTARGQRQAIDDKSVYRMDVSGIDRPDARRIARVPDMESALIAAAELASYMPEALASLNAGGCDVSLSSDIRAALTAFRKAIGEI